MAGETFPKDIEDVGRPQPTLPIGTGGKPPPAGEFKSFMEGTQGTTLGKTTGQQSPFDVMQSQSLAASGADIKTLLAQVNTAQTTLGDLNNELNTPKLKLKQSQRWLLKQKFANSNAHLRSANEKLGTPPTPPFEEPTEGGPIVKFLSYLTDGQNQLSLAHQKLGELNASGKTLNPTDLLLIQIKLAKAQQEMEYSSVVLSKAVDDMKTLMNVQL